MKTPNYTATNTLQVDASTNGHAAAPAPAGVTLTIPLNITVTLGEPMGVATAAVREEPRQDLLEIQIDPDYSTRAGYDPNYLGFEVPLPRLSNAIRGQAFKLDGATGAAAYELKYHHYSVLFNKKRRLAFVAAVNLDAAPRFKHKRDKKDKWFMDGRVPEEVQAGEELYAGNPLDRGHLVRRDDAAWGATKKEAQLANDDTFHFTNCSPQHEIYNQSGLASGQGLLLWGNLENHVAKQAKENNKKLCVFNGPVFRSNDRKHFGVQIPKEFFKVVVFEHDDGEPRALAFILSQASLIKDLPQEEFEVGPYQPFQVTISDLENRTKMKFGAVRHFDPLEGVEHERFFESDVDAVAIESLEDVIVGARSPRRRLAPR